MALYGDFLSRYHVRTVICCQVAHALMRTRSGISARYDLEAARGTLDRGDIRARAPNLWRYGALLPVQAPQYAHLLGERFTPLIRARRLGQSVGFDGL